jgi:hypothetical protein
MPGKKRQEYIFRLEHTGTVFNLCDITQEAISKNKIQYLKRRDKLPLVKTLYGEDSTVEGSDTG